MGDGSSLLLITNRYPYQPGEEYLHTEIPFLAEQFNEVIILPVMRSGDQAHLRDLPTNVRVIDAQIKHSWLTRLMMLTEGPGEPYDRTPTISLRARMYERYFAARSQLVSRRLLPDVSRFVEESGTRVTVIYAYWFYMTTSVGAELRDLIPALADVPIIARGHGYDVNEAASPVRHLPARDRLFKSVYSLHPTADTITARLQSEWPQYAEKISTRRLGVAAADATPRSNRNGVKVLSCSSLSPIKRLDLMAASIAECKRQGMNITWTHIGTGSPKQEANLRRVAKAAGLGDSFIRTGQLRNTEVYRVLESGEHTLFLNTSSSESVSFSMSEAMSAGLPVVGTDVVGTHEILTDKVNGRLVSGDPSPTEIAEAIAWISSVSDEKYEQLCINARSVSRHLLDPTAEYSSFARELKHIGSIHEK